MIDYKIKKMNFVPNSYKGVMVIYEGEFVDIEDREGNIINTYVRSKKLKEVEFDIHAINHNQLTGKLNKILKKEYPNKNPISKQND